MSGEHVRLYFMSRLKLASLLSSNALILGLGFVSGILIARYASVEVRGDFGEVLIWSTLLSGIFLGGLVEYYLAKRAISEFPLKLRYVFCYCAIAIFACIYALYVNNLASYAYYAILFIPLNLYASIKIAQVTLQGRVHALSAYKVVQPSVYVLGVLTLIMLGQMSVHWLLSANIVSNLIIYLVLRHSDRRLEVLKKPEVINRREWQDVYMSSVLGVVTAQLDKIVVVMLFSAYEVAHYLVGLTVVGAPLVIVAQASATMLLANSVIKGDVSYRQYLPTILYVSIAMIIAAVTMILLLPYVVEYVLGEKYFGLIGIVIHVAVIGVIANVRVLVIRILRIQRKNGVIIFCEMAMVALVVAMGLYAKAVELNLVDFLRGYGLVTLIALGILFWFGRTERKVL